MRLCTSSAFEAYLRRRVIPHQLLPLESIRLFLRNTVGYAFGTAVVPSFKFNKSADLPFRSHMRTARQITAFFVSTPCVVRHDKNSPWASYLATAVGTVANPSVLQLIIEDRTEQLRCYLSFELPHIPSISLHLRLRVRLDIPLCRGEPEPAFVVFIGSVRFHPESNSPCLRWLPLQAHRRRLVRTPPTSKRCLFRATTMQA